MVTKTLDLMETSILENIGLSNAEIKVYLSLLELGSTKAGGVLKHSGLQNSVVHMTLNKLVEKGLASFVRHGKVKFYRATDPRNIMRWMDEKKHQFETILPGLLARQNMQERQEAEVFEGIRGFKAMLYSFIEDAEPGDDYLAFAFITKTGQYDEEVFGFYREFTQDRTRRGLTIKLVAHSSQRERFKRLGWDAGAIHFVDYPTLQNISICRNKVVFTPWEERQVSFMITSQQLADNYREYFYSIWNYKK